MTGTHKSTHPNIVNMAHNNRYQARPNTPCCILQEKSRQILEVSNVPPRKELCSNLSHMESLSMGGV